MNPLTHLSWNNYLALVALLLVGYYIIIAFKFFKTDIRQFADRISGRTAGTALPEQLVYQEAPIQDQPNEVEGYTEQELYNNYPDEDSRADELTATLKRLISESSGKAYASGKLLWELKSCFKEQRNLKNSPYRHAINELVVNECERTGTAQLNTDEVDEWWSD